jgi:hypothetical protein
MVHDVVPAQVSVDQPEPCRVPAQEDEHGVDSPGCLGQEPPHCRVDGPPGQLVRVPSSGPGQVPDVQDRPGEPGRRAESPGVLVERGDHPAEVRDQPPGRPGAAGPALDPGERDAARSVWKPGCGRPDAEPGQRDGQAGVAGQRGQPGQLGVELGVAAAAGRADPDHKALAAGGVAAEQVVVVLSHPAQPPDRYALLVQRGPSQVLELADERAGAAVHVLSICPGSAGRLRAGLAGRAELGAVADGGLVADAEQVGELERVAAVGLGFSVEPVSAQALRGDTSRRTAAWT